MQLKALDLPTASHHRMTVPSVGLGQGGQPPSLSESHSSRVCGLAFCSNR